MYNYTYLHIGSTSHLRPLLTSLQRDPPCAKGRSTQQILHDTFLHKTTLDLLVFLLRTRLSGRLVSPYPGHTIPTPTRQMITRPSQIDGDDTVLVSLQHELRLTRRDVPELY